MTQQEMAEYNAMLRKWGAFVNRKLSTSARKFVHGKSGSLTRGIKKHQSRTELKLAQSLRNKADYHYGLIDYIGFNFERHGVFVHKGVGRGHVMSGGIVVRGANPTKEAVNYAKAKNREAQKTITGGTVNRKPDEWFNPVLETVLPALSDKIAEMHADAAVNATKMYIK